MGSLFCNRWCSGYIPYKPGDSETGIYVCSHLTLREGKEAEEEGQNVWVIERFPVFVLENWPEYSQGNSMFFPIFSAYLFFFSLSLSPVLRQGLSQKKKTFCFPD